MKLVINFKEESFDSDRLSVDDILKLKKVKFPHLVRVQVNGEMVKKENYGTTLLRDGDKVNFLFAIGGG